MKDYCVCNKYTGHALGMMRAISREVAVTLARTLFGCYASVD